MARHQVLYRAVGVILLHSPEQSLRYQQAFGLAVNHFQFCSLLGLPVLLVEGGIGVIKRLPRRVDFVQRMGALLLALFLLI